MIGFSFKKSFLNQRKKIFQVRTLTVKQIVELRSQKGDEETVLRGYEQLIPSSFYFLGRVKECLIHSPFENDLKYKQEFKRVFNKVESFLKEMKSKSDSLTVQEVLILQEKAKNKREEIREASSLFVKALGEKSKEKAQTPILQNFLNKAVTEFYSNLTKFECFQNSFSMICNSFTAKESNVCVQFDLNDLIGEIWRDLECLCVEKSYLVPSFSFKKQTEKILCCNLEEYVFFSLNEMLKNSVYSLQRLKENQKVEIKIETTQIDGKVRIVISDNGTGIEEQRKNQIFDFFFSNAVERIPTYQIGTQFGEKLQGEGVGLSLSRIYCREMIGGDLKLLQTSQEKQLRGSIFEMTFSKNGESQIL